MKEYNIPEFKFKIAENLFLRLKADLARSLKESYCEDDLYFERLRHGAPSFDYYTLGASLMIRKHGMEYILIYKEPRILAKGIIKIREEIRVPLSNTKKIKNLLRKLELDIPESLSYETLLKTIAKKYRYMGYVLKERNVYIQEEGIKIMLDRLIFTDKSFHKLGEPMHVLEFRGSIEKIHALKHILKIKGNILIKNNYRLLVEARYK